MPLSTLVNLLEPLIQKPTPNGAVPSLAIEGVSFMRCNQSLERTPLIYEPSLIFITQGQKIGYLGDRVIHYNPGHYLVQTLPLPFECETYATAQAPLLGLSVAIEPGELAELVRAMPAASLPEPVPMASVAMTPSMQEAVTRLAQTLHDPGEAAVMGKARVREVLYEALKDKQGPALRALVANSGHYSRVIDVLEKLHGHFDDSISVEDMASQANMSVSAFHKHFKEVTRCAPLQYLKRLRLIKARGLLAQNELNVSQTAMRVGYRSIHQFSRDYKSYFGITPNRDRSADMELAG